MSGAERPVYDFGPFRLDPTERRLLRDGQPVALTPKTFDTLVVLVERAGLLVEKKDLMKALWPDSIVEEGNLAVTISMLRKALGEGGDEQKYIETVSKRGYRFGVPVSEPRRDEAVPAAAEGLPSSTAVRRRPTALAAMLAVAAAAAVLIWTATRPRAADTGASVRAVKSLAVLPFQALGAGTGDDYLGVGMADALITKLGSTGQVVVRPTSAVQKYGESAARDAQAAGREQGVDAVLDGHIQREGERVRVTVQLIRVEDGAQLWADTLEEKGTNLFALQDALCERVARSMRLSLSGDEKRQFAKRFTDNREAYQAYVKGRYFWNKRTEPALKRGLQYFQQAIALDPSYALAYAGLADSYAMLSIYTVLSPREAYPKAKEAAMKALALDEGLAEAHASLGVISFYYDWNGPSALQQFRRAVEINPNYAVARMWSGLTLAAMGRLAEADAELRRAQELDPLSLIINTNVGWILYLQGRNEPAIETYKKTIELDPGFARAHFRLGLAHAQAGDHEAAIQALRDAVRLSGGDAHYESFLAHVCAVSGRRAEARRLLDGLRSRSSRQYVPAFGIALVYLGLGEEEQALDWLEKALDERSYGLVFLNVDPWLAPLRSDPRLAALARRMSLSAA